MFHALNLRSVVSAILAAVIASGMATAIHAEELEKFQLWSNGAPGEPATQPADEPVIFVARPAADANTGAAVVICPGGGYGHLAMDYEGTDVAKWFSTFGVTGVALKYRHSASGHRHPVPMMDGQRAIRTVRARAGEWGIDPHRVGVLGFSAGGHLASTLATHFDDGDPQAEDPVDREGSRPDFAILCYPVISMTAPYHHAGSKKNLLGPESDEALAKNLSNDLQVTSQTPPTFIFQTDEDRSVPAEHCVAFYLALRKAGVPAEMHIFQNGPHGVGMGRDILGTNTWPDRCREWMQNRGLLKQE